MWWWLGRMCDVYIRKQSGCGLDAVTLARVATISSSGKASDRHHLIIPKIPGCRSLRALVRAIASREPVYPTPLLGMKWSAGDPYRIALFYRYVAIDDVNMEVSNLRQRCEELGLLGRVLVSKEGINGTLAGSIEAISSFVAGLNQDPRFAKIDWKFTDDSGDQLPFLGLSIREVDEIISCGRARSFIGENISFDSESYGGIAGTGTHLTPQQFHEAIARKDGVVLDVRNEFEYDIGHFDGSKNLKTFNYAETFDVLDEIVPAPSQVDASAASKEGQDGGAVSGQQERNVYMYCTGGIRCEKASAYLCAKGFKNVFQLEGGIHRYLETYPDGGLFHGKNFVFDSRVAVGPAAGADVVSGAGPSSEGAERNSATTAAQPVVGKCIDCDAAHDVYSGHIVCTVCRMPVLVCPACVASSDPPGEYHCSRHRDLKHVYFTVLTHFTEEQLRAQLQALRQLEAESATHLEKVRAAERIHRRRVASAQHAKKRPVDDGASAQSEELDSASVHLVPAPASAPADSAVVGTDGAASPAAVSAEMLSKQRRRTLRKQVERIEALLKHHAQASQQQPGRAELAAGEAAVAVAEFNPKTRGGWGFWKS